VQVNDMASNLDIYHGLRTRAATSHALTVEADAPAALDGGVYTDYSFIFERREVRIEFPLHKLIGKYAEYGKLFAAQN
jgi:hypothetical protein